MQHSSTFGITYVVISTIGNHIIDPPNWLVHEHQLSDIFLHRWHASCITRAAVSTCAFPNNSSTTQKFPCILDQYPTGIGKFIAEQMMSALPGPIPASWQPKINRLLIEKVFASISLFVISTLSSAFLLLVDSSLDITFWQVKQTICISLDNPKFSADTTINGSGGMHGIVESSKACSKKDSHFLLSHAPVIGPIAIKVSYKVKNCLLTIFFDICINTNLANHIFIQHFGEWITVEKVVSVCFSEGCCSCWCVVVALIVGGGWENAVGESHFQLWLSSPILFRRPCPPVPIWDTRWLPLECGILLWCLKI